MPRNHLIQMRRGTAAQWTAANPTLAAGEHGFETDTGKFKIGNGSTAWNSLAYAGIAGTGTDNNIVRWNGTDALQDSTIAITDGGAVTQTVTTALTNVTDPILIVNMTSSGTVAAGFGGSTQVYLEDDGGNLQLANLVQVEWVDLPNRKARVTHKAYDTSAREYLRGEASGSAAKISFLGATAVVAQTGDVGTAMVTFGLMSGTPTFAWANITGEPTTLVGFGITDARVKLTAARTYYVRTDGSDSNDGLTDSSGGAFLTVQKGIDVASALDNGGFDITIAVKAGTFTGANTLKTFVGSGLIAIVGVGNTTIISTTSANCFTGSSVVGTYKLKDMKLTTTTSGNCIDASGITTQVQTDAVEFGAAASIHVVVTGGALVTILSGYTISGAAAVHWYTGTHGNVTRNAVLTVTITGTPAFSTAFAYAFDGGLQVVANLTFSGSATGTRYTVTGNGVIDTGGGGATYLPGNVGGSTASGGQYI